MNTLYNKHISKFNLSRHYLDGIHYVAPTRPDPHKTPMIILHGIFSSSYPFLELADHLGAYVIDLPGWGFSEMYPSHINSLDAYLYTIHKISTQILQSYEPCTKITIVAHSFSAFVTIHFAHRYPELIDRFVLVSPAGLFPVSSDVSIYWAFLFYTSLHYLFIYYFSWLLFPFVKWYTTNHLIHFSVTHFSSHLPAWKMIREFIDMHFIWSVWKYPCISTLLDVQVPYVFIYGEFDTLTPSHEGVMVNMLTEGVVKCFCIKGTYHNPHYKLSTFLPVLNDALHVCSYVPIRIRNSSCCKGYWSRHYTREQINKMYETFLGI